MYIHKNESTPASCWSETRHSVRWSSNQTEQKKLVFSRLTRSNHMDNQSSWLGEAHTQKTHTHRLSYRRHTETHRLVAASSGLLPEEERICIIDPALYGEIFTGRCTMGRHCRRLSFCDVTRRSIAFFAVGLRLVFCSFCPRHCRKEIVVSSLSHGKR